MTLIIRRGTVIQVQVLRIERSVRERNLIVVCKVERFRQRVRSTKLEVASVTFLQTHQEPVVLRSHTRLEIGDCIWSTDNGIENSSNRTTDDEVGSEVMQVIGS